MLKIFLKYFIILLATQTLHCGEVTIKSVTCKTHDANFSRFDLCEMAPTAKNIPGISLIIRFLRLPVTNIHFRYVVGRTGSPPLIALNNSWDLCAFLRNGKSSRALATLFKQIASFTNINHSCPFNHDVIIQKFAVPHGNPNFVFFPGDYFAKVETTIDGIKRFTIDIIINNQI
ncbi:uncharacterized protein LOC131997981 [Stomoxys calcitrans]|uniref:uncharacterized protein LOC131997981 n=1 Tax=Stomoxys calcitrans TaxID=35570 RepID=UPI0027E28956|nr:uncharacterized protein LOC131997981 [Stomoxys calcitrans]